MKIDFEKIELAKAEAALSTKEMLQNAGVPLGTWNGILRNRTASPKTIGKLAKALGVRASEIVKGENT